MVAAHAALAAEPAPDPETKPAAEPSADAPPAEAAPLTASEREKSTRDEYSAPGESGGSEVADEQYGHGMQFGLRADVVGGYRMVFRYDKSPFCRQPDPAKAYKDQQKFCGHGAPFAADVALSFAVFDFAEPFVWARFGFAGEPQTNTNEVMAFGVGARIYTMSDSKLKIFVEPALGAEVEDGAGNAQWVDGQGQKFEYKTDFLFHLSVGPHYDFAKAFGIYLNAGLTTGVLRYIHTQLELGLGAQVRVP
jgi:hypothetical protein